MAAMPNPIPASMPAGAGAATAANSAASNPEVDKQRVSLILDINSHLLEIIQNLQAEGKGGDVQSPAQPSAPPPQQQHQQPDGEQQQKKPSREYVEPLRRMQANLAYLASLAEKHQKPNANAPPWPQVMTAPPGDEKLAVMYQRLQLLFPQWRLHQQQLMQAAQARHAAGAQQNMSGPMPPQSLGVGGGHDGMTMG